MRNFGCERIERAHKTVWNESTRPLPISAFSAPMIEEIAFATLKLFVGGKIVVNILRAPTWRATLRFVRYQQPCRVCSSLWVHGIGVCPTVRSRSIFRFALVVSVRITSRRSKIALDLLFGTHWYAILRTDLIRFGHRKQMYCSRPAYSNVFTCKPNALS